jgi:hypothetical protein
MGRCVICGELTDTEVGVELSRYMSYDRINIGFLCENHYDQYIRIIFNHIDFIKKMEGI